jgi:hypothetical protein
MSRGIGRHQRELLAALRAHADGGAATAHDAALGLTTAELASAARYGTTRMISILDRADLVGTRKALAGLERRKLVIRLGTFGRERSCRWHVGLKP